jgi:UDP-N-acetyl-D-glucosamine dehydrogenase
MKVTVIGQGYVGLPLALNAAKSGFNVIGFDSNRMLVTSLNKNESHIEDVSDNDIREVIENNKYMASFDPDDIKGSDIVIIAVPTPLNADREPDLNYIISACEVIGRFLNLPALIISESTSYPGTLRNIIKPMIEKNSISEMKHEYAISPERIDPGNSIWKVTNTPRLYSGLTSQAASKVYDFYNKFCENLVEVSTPEVAEAAKLFENTFRQVNIALVNEFSLILSAMQIPVLETINAAATKPYGFMKFVPGIGVGGHCIPVDPSYLAFSARNAGIVPEFIELANKTNMEMPESILDKITKSYGSSFKGKKVLVCGLSYKSNISDTRESPTEILIEALEKRGAEVICYDPLVKNWSGEISKSIEVDNYDLTIVAVLHSVMDVNEILQSSPFVFDCTGKILEAHHL